MAPFDITWLLSNGTSFQHCIVVFTPLLRAAAITYIAMPAVLHTAGGTRLSLFRARQCRALSYALSHGTTLQPYTLWAHIS